MPFLHLGLQPTKNELAPKQLIAFNSDIFHFCKGLIIIERFCLELSLA